MTTERSIGLTVVNTDSKAEKSMEKLDPRTKKYKKSGRDRRKADDPSYQGPERRLAKKREKEILEIIKQLEMETEK